mmetsp:Transcript_8396/g.8247  ORF Transcript_8396/g.8247 Transcript_8396/m.8247 type:complete len:105 (+) Transcript_8396:729-1043(+)
MDTLDEYFREAIARTSTGKAMTIKTTTTTTTAEEEKKPTDGDTNSVVLDPSRTTPSHTADAVDAEDEDDDDDTVVTLSTNDSLAHLSRRWKRRRQPLRKFRTII